MKKKKKTGRGNHLAIYKSGRGLKSSKWPERDSNPGPTDGGFDSLAPLLQ